MLFEPKKLLQDETRYLRLADFGGGRNTTISPALLNVNESPTAECISFDQKGTIRPGWGRIKRYPAPFSTSPVTGLGEFRKSDGTTRLMIGAGGSVFYDSPNLSWLWKGSDFDKGTYNEMEKIEGKLKPLARELTYSGLGYVTVNDEGTGSDGNLSYRPSAFASMVETDVGVVVTKIGMYVRNTGSSRSARLAIRSNYNGSDLVSVNVTIPSYSSFVLVEAPVEWVTTSTSFWIVLDLLGHTTNVIPERSTVTRTGRYYTATYDYDYYWETYYYFRLKYEIAMPGKSTTPVFEDGRLKVGRYDKISISPNVAFTVPEPEGPTFTRDSTAYNPEDGSQVAVNEPRYVEGPWAGSKALLVEEATTNLLSANQSSVETDTSGFRPGRNISVIRSNEWAAHGQYSLKVEGATNIVADADRLNIINISHLANVPSCGSGVIYNPNDQSIDVWIRWAGGSMSSWTLAPKEAKRIYVVHTYTADGSADLQLAEHAGPGLPFFLDMLQVERKPYPTSWTLGGTTRSPETLTIPTAGVLNPQEGTLEGVFEYKATIHNVVSNAWLIAHGTNASSPWQNALGVKITSNRWEVWANDNSGSPPIVASWDGALTDGLHRFALRWSQAEVSFWIDGIKRIIINNPRLPQVQANSLYIGSWIIGNMQINSLIDDLRISNRARTDEEILAAYESGQPLPVDEWTTYKLPLDGSLTPANLEETSWEVNFKITSLASQQTILDLNGDTNKSLCVYIKTDGKVEMACGTGTDTVTFTSTLTVSPGTDYTARITRGAFAIKVYLNDELYIEAPVISKLSSTKPTYFGSSASASNQGIVGQMWGLKATNKDGLDVLYAPLQDSLTTVLKGEWITPVIDCSASKDLDSGYLSAIRESGIFSFVSRSADSPDGPWTPWIPASDIGKLRHEPKRYVQAKIVSTDGTINSVTLYFDGIPTATLLKDDFMPNSMYVFKTFGDRVIIANGHDPLYAWDGNSEKPELVGGDPPPFAFIEVHQNRLWGWGGPMPARLRYSELLNVDSWPALNFIDVSPDDGDYPTGLKTYGTYLLLPKSKRIAVLIGDQTSNYAVTWLESSFGIQGVNAISSTDKYLSYVAQDGVRFTDMTSSVTAVERLLPDWEKINKRLLYKAAQIYWGHILLTALPGAEAVDGNTEVWMYDALRNAWTIRKDWKLSCFLRFNEYGEEVLLAGDSTTGQVYKIVHDPYNDGEAVEYSWRSKDLNFGEPERYKVWNVVFLQVEGEYEQRTLKVRFFVDGQETGGPDLTVPAGKGMIFTFRLVPPQYGAVYGQRFAISLEGSNGVHLITIGYTLRTFSVGV